MVFGGETFMGHIYVGAPPPKKKKNGVDEFKDYVL